MKLEVERPAVEQSEGLLVAWDYTKNS